MFCSKCSTENPDDANACSRCGSPIIATTPPSASDVESLSPASSATQQDGKPPVSTALKISVSIATLLIPFIGLIMGIIYLKDKTDASRRAAGKLWIAIAIFSAIINVVIVQSA